MYRLLFTSVRFENLYNSDICFIKRIRAMAVMPVVRVLIVPTEYSLREEAVLVLSAL